MSTTIRRALAALLALGLTAALAACGDDDDSSGDDSASETTEESDDSTDTTEEGTETTEPDEATETTEAGEASGENPDSEFCQDLQEFSDEVEGLADVSSSDFASGYRQLADSMGDLEVPDEISDDWDQLSEAIDGVADAVEGASQEDITSGAAFEGLEEELGNLEGVGQRVDEFTQSECGFSIGGTPAAEEPTG
jgi:hypothetical protein